jgi:hypothetical protein
MSSRVNPRVTQSNKTELSRAENQCALELKKKHLIVSEDLVQSEKPAWPRAANQSSPEQKNSALWNGKKNI